MPNASSRLGSLIDISFDRLSPIAGAISGVVLETSAVEKVANADTVTVLFTSTGTVAGTWQFLVGTDPNGNGFVDQATLPRPVVIPPSTTGGGGGGTITFNMQDFPFFKILFQPTAGAGNADAKVTKIVSRPALGMRNTHQLSAQFICTGTFTASWLVEQSDTFSESDAIGIPRSSGDWYTAIDAVNAAIAIAGPAAAAQNLAIHNFYAGPLAMRVTFSPTLMGGASTAKMAVVMKEWA